MVVMKSFIFIGAVLFSHYSNPMQILKEAFEEMASEFIDLTVDVYDVLMTSKKEESTEQSLPISVVRSKKNEDLEECSAWWQSYNLAVNPEQPEHFAYTKIGSSYEKPAIKINGNKIPCDVQYRQYIKYNKSGSLLAWLDSSKDHKSNAVVCNAQNLKKTIIDPGNVLNFGWATDKLALNYLSERYGENISVYHIDAAKIGDPNYKPEEKYNLQDRYHWIASFDPSNSILVTAFSNDITFHDSQTGKAIVRLPIGGIGSVEWNEDGTLLTAIARKKLYFITREGKFLSLDLPEKYKQYCLGKWRNKAVFPVISVNDSPYLNESSLIKIYSIITKDFIGTIESNDTIHDADIKPNGQIIAIGCDKKIDLYTTSGTKNCHPNGSWCSNKSPLE